MIAKFDKVNLKNIRAELNAVLAKYAVTQGMSLELGNIKFSEGEFEAKLKASIKGAVTRTDTMLASQMQYLNLQQSGLSGRKLVSYNSRAHAYPFVYEQAGKKSKCSVEMAKMYFANK